MLSIERQRHTKLKHQLAFYQELIDSSHGWEYLINPAGQHLYISPSVTRISGYEAELFYQDDSLIERVIHPEDLELYQQKLEQLLTTLQMVCFDLRICTKAGKIKWMHHTCHPRMSPEGEVQGIRGSLHHIPRPTSEGAGSTLNQEKATALLNVSGESAILIDLAGNLLDVNAVAAERLGHSREELIGKHAYDVLPPQLAKSRMAQAQQVIDSKELAVFLDERNGMIFENRVYPILNDKQEVYQLAIYAKDVTQEKQAERQLKESEARFAAISSQMQEGIVLVDRRGNYVYANPAFCNMSGYSLEEILDSVLFDLKADPDDPCLAFEETINVGQSENRGVPLRRKDGSVYQAWVKAQQVVIGGDMHMLALVRDITHELAAEQEVRDAQDKLATFIETNPAGMLFVSIAEPMPLSLDDDARYEWLKQHAYVRDCNENCARQYGFASKEEMKGTAAYDVFQQNDELMREVLDRYGKLNYRVTNLENTQITQQGETLFYRDHSTPTIIDNHLYAVNIVSANITEQKKLERQVDSFKEEMSYFFEMNPVGMYYVAFAQPMPLSLSLEEKCKWIKDQARFTQVNEVMARQYGFSRGEEMIGMSFFQLLGEREELFRGFVQLYDAAGYQVTNRETQIENENGETSYHISSSVPIIENRQLHAVYGIRQDVTSERQMTVELQKAKAKLSQFIDLSPARMIFVGLKKPMPLALTGDDRIDWLKQHSFIEDCNETTIREYGFPSKKAIIGQFTFDMLQRNEPNYRKLIANYEQNNFRVSNLQTTETSMKGEVLHFINNTTPIIIDDHLYGLGLTSANITEQKRLEQELKHSRSALLSYKERLEQTLTGTESGTFIHDFQTGYLHFDEGGAEIIGLEQGDILYEDYFDYVHPEDRDSLYEKIAAQFARCETQINRDYRLRTTGQPPKYVELKAFVDYRDGQPLKTYGLVSDITEKRQLEERLSAFKTRLSHFFEMNPVGMFHADFRQPMPLALSLEEKCEWIKEHATYTHVNDAMAKQYGFSRGEEMVGMSFFQLLREREDLFRQFIKLYDEAQYQATNLETQLTNWRGEQVYHISSSVPIIEDDHLHAIYGVQLDVTEQRRLHLKVQQAQAKLSQFIESSPARMLFVGFSQPMPLSLKADARYEWIKQHSYIEDCNETLIREYGFAGKEALIGMSTFDLVQRDERLFRDVIASYSRGDFRVSNLESSEINQHGEVLHFINNTTPIIRDGHLYAVGLTSANITDQKRLEAELKHTKERLTYFFKATPASLLTLKFKKPMPMTLDEEEKFAWIKKYEYIADCNDAFARAFGIRRENIIGKSSYQLYGKSDKVLREVVGPGITQDFHFSNVLTEEITPSGEILYFISSAIPIIKNKHLYEVFVISMNITSEKEQERKLEEALIAKNKLFSIISHDLRAPLASIQSSVDAVVDCVEKGDFEFVKQVIPLVKETTVHTADLLDNLLMWAKSQRNTIRFQPEKASIQDIVAEAMVLPKKAAAHKGIQLIAKLGTDVTISVDRHMVHTIIRNLLSNAIKFTPEQGTIALASELGEDHLLLKVSDTGVGMSQEQIQKLFQLEHASSKPGTQGEQGTGLGLLLCHEFVQKHRGSIKVDSVVGKGTTFTVSLPTGELPAPASPGSGDQPKRAGEE